ncbi:hypothetical protein IGI37_001369 [Enterococcus sp. AZ194]|uniref:hypothetical protein n=1 Tax=Enterococcus sp. AZ194 TaxID=2774629 RepID=UPI003F20CF7D
MNKLVTGILLFSVLNYQMATPFVLSHPLIYSKALTSSAGKNSSSSSFEFQKNSIVSGEGVLMLQKADSKTQKKVNKPSDEKKVQELQWQLAKLEREVRTKDCDSSTSIFGQQLKALSGNLLCGESRLVINKS